MLGIPHRERATGHHLGSVPRWAASGAPTGQGTNASQRFTRRSTSSIVARLASIALCLCLLAPQVVEGQGANKADYHVVDERGQVALWYHSKDSITDEQNLSLILAPREESLERGPQIMLSCGRFDPREDRSEPVIYVIEPDAPRAKSAPEVVPIHMRFGQEEPVTFGFVTRKEGPKWLDFAPHDLWPVPPWVPADHYSRNMTPLTREIWTTILVLVGKIPTLLWRAEGLPAREIVVTRGIQRALEFF